MKKFHIIVLHRQNDAAKITIGILRQLPNGKWSWHALGRTSKKQFDTQEQAENSAKRALGKVCFEEVPQSSTSN